MEWSGACPGACPWRSGWRGLGSGSACGAATRWLPPSWTDCSAQPWMRSRWWSVREARRPRRRRPCRSALLPAELREGGVEVIEEGRVDLPVQELPEVHARGAHVHVKRHGAGPARPSPPLRHAVREVREFPDADRQPLFFVWPPAALAPSDPSASPVSTPKGGGHCKNLRLIRPYVTEIARFSPARAGGFCGPRPMCGLRPSAAAVGGRHRQPASPCARRKPAGRAATTGPRRSPAASGRCWSTRKATC